MKDEESIPDLIELRIPLPGPNLGHRFDIAFHSKDLWDAYRTIHKLGIEESKNLLALGGQIAIKARDRKYPDGNLAIDAIWNGLSDPIASGIDKWETEEDQLNSLLYWLLTSKTITRAQAAGLASQWTGKRIEQEPFRKKLDRWAKFKGLDPIRQTIRKPRNQLSGKK